MSQSVAIRFLVESLSNAQSGNELLALIDAYLDNQGWLNNNEGCNSPLFLYKQMLESLTNLLSDWCDSQQLEYLSADDLLIGYYNELTQSQRDWLTNYIAIWDLSANISTEVI